MNQSPPPGASRAHYFVDLSHIAPASYGAEDGAVCTTRSHNGAVAGRGLNTIKTKPKSFKGGTKNRDHCACNDEIWKFNHLR